MNKIFFIFILLFISNCTLNKVIKHHGVHFLEKKKNSLELNITNKNDILKILVINRMYINIYNRLVNLTRNKDLYKGFTTQDTFSDRLIFLLLHFAFFLKVFKQDQDKKTLQEIYDFFFRQLELSIREIGYGDQSINKKMKDYINLFYSMIEKLHNWEDLSISNKRSILSSFLNNSADTSYLVDYFEKYRLNLLNNSLNSYIKGVINP